jgi:acetylornithine/LysW-gamma-L-lysine aminotransferase
MSTRNGDSQLVRCVDYAWIADVEDRHGSGAYPRRPIALTHGRGARVWDTDGREYIDCASGQGVALLGHAHPAVVDAIQRQSEALITCPEIFYHERRAALYEILADVTPGDLCRFFLCNSGAEAVEGALKLARLFTGRPGIVAMQRGFHGRTLGALSTTWDRKYRDPFAPLLPGVTHIPFNDLGAADEVIGAGTAAVLVEVVQGEGGVYPAQEDFLAGLCRLCAQRGALLIFDEVQTGLGRTGRWFACQHYGVAPDIMCLGKGLGGGVPIGAVAWRDSLGQIPHGSHGSTFGGNPLACAAAVATLRMLARDNLPTRAGLLGDQLLADLRALDSPLVREVRGLGLMIGVELRRRVTPLLKALLARGVLALPAGSTVLRLLPPLVISEGELATVVETIAEALDEEVTQDA